MIANVARWKRIIYYLLINILVTSCTMVTILYAWENFREPGGGIDLPAFTAGTETVIGSGGAEAEAPVAITYEAYTVTAGDTLAGIAAQFGVSVEAIMTANNLDNPNVLTVGQELQIPLPAEPGGLPESTSTPEPTATPDLTSTPPSLPDQPTATTLPEDHVLHIEIVTVIAPGVLDDERVVITLLSEGQLSMAGWQLVDAAGPIYTFPALTLFQDGAVSVYTASGTNNAVELHWGLDETVWEQGEVVHLVDPNGIERASFEIP
jgi:LysM repeat protein